MPQHDDQPAAPSENPAPQNPVLAMLRGLLWDVGLPVLTYYALHEWVGIAWYRLEIGT